MSDELEDLEPSLAVHSVSYFLQCMRLCIRFGSQVAFLVVLSFLLCKRSVVFSAQPTKRFSKYASIHFLKHALLCVLNAVITLRNCNITNSYAYLFVFGVFVQLLKTTQISPFHVIHLNRELGFTISLKRIWLDLRNILRASVHYCFKALKYYVLIYHVFLDFLLRNAILFSTQTFNNFNWLMLGSFNVISLQFPVLILKAAFVGTLVLFVYSLQWICFDELYHFLNISNVNHGAWYDSEAAVKSLKETLALKSSATKTYQAHVFFTNALNSKTLRSNIFSLSPPGNRPYYFQAAYDLIHSVTSGVYSRLQQYNELSSYQMKGMQANGVVPAAKSSVSSTTGAPNIDHLISSQDLSNGTKRPMATKQETIRTPRNNFEHLLLLLQMKINYRYKKPGRQATPVSQESYLIECCHKVFDDWQICCGALEVLSHLVACSYTEDQYGVLQHSLTDVVDDTVLLYKELQNFRFPMSSNSNQQWKPSAQLVNQRGALLSAARHALHRIALTIHKDVRFLRLEPEVEDVINNFAHFTE